ncbi:MAG TPA: NAD(P)H-hydrate dehydratase [Candidatus Peribacterales bacterium]|nr:NAD(P)H-hydrate dehydratase [Candidatus Peribacterales bacterium]
MQRDPHSHKGQNGVVTIVGGSRTMHGAPTFSSLAAEASGVDLIHPCIPECHESVIRSFSLNFIAHTFRGDDLSKADVSGIEEILATSTAAVIGPGLASYDTTQKAAQTLISEAAVPMVIDGTALQPWTFDALNGKTAVITPHIGELSRMQEQVLQNKSHEELKDIVCTIAAARNVTIVLKGATDIIASSKSCSETKGGNAGLTKGGTGDALAGLIAGLMAQGIDPADACIMASTIIKRAATVLYPEKGYGFTTFEVIQQIPHLLHTYA